jgi:hypothetical protein
LTYMDIMPPGTTVRQHGMRAWRPNLDFSRGGG